MPCTHTGKENIPIRGRKTRQDQTSASKRKKGQTILLITPHGGSVESPQHQSPSVSVSMSHHSPACSPLHSESPQHQSPSVSILTSYHSPACSPLHSESPQHQSSSVSVPQSPTYSPLHSTCTSPSFHAQQSPSHSLFYLYTPPLLPSPTPTTTQESTLLPSIPVSLSQPRRISPRNLFSGDELFKGMHMH